MWSINIVTLLSLLVSSVQLQTLTGCHYTSWYSEEQVYPTENRSGYPVRGLACRGTYCDQLRAEQCTHFSRGSHNVDLVSRICDEPVLPFTDDGMNSRSCPVGRFVETLRCDLLHCDNIIFKCCLPLGWYLDVTRTRETPWFSNGSGESCPLMHVMVGGYCRGHYCSDMRLICAPIVI